MSVWTVCIELKNSSNSGKPSKIVVFIGPVYMWFWVSLLLHVFEMVLNT
jgi:hypothetical protein